MARTLYVFIYLPGRVEAVPAGRLTCEDGIGLFEYGRRYLERPDAEPADAVSLPLGKPAAPTAMNGGLYGAFRDALPDYWGRLVAAAEASVPPETLDDLDLLLKPNATRVGCLDFRRTLEQGAPPLGPPEFQDLAELLDAAERLQKGEKVRIDLLRLLEQGTSLGGARPKCTIRHANDLWIAKFPAVNDAIRNPRAEYATMRLARRAGLNVADVDLVTAGGRDVLLVKRFDRHGPGGAMRSAFVSALTVLGAAENDPAQWSYLLLADRMRKHFAAGPGELAELFRRMVYNMLCRNTDDHPRNHAFVQRQGRMELSPAYDLVPALTRAGVGTEFRLAMSAGRQGREAGLENAISECGRFGLTPESATRIVEHMVEVVRGWEELFAADGLTARELEILGPSFGLAGR